MPGHPPMGRPIVAAQGSVLENISMYIDSLLQPYVLRTTSYNKDTKDFISKIENLRIPKDAMLVTMDVVSLCTCIPHEEIRMTIQMYLEKSSGAIPPIHFILDINILLEKNYFLFQWRIFFSKVWCSYGQSVHPKRC